MIRNFEQILEKAKGRGRKKLAVPAPRSRRIFQLLEEAERAGLISPVVVGEGGEDQPIGADVIASTVRMARNGEADMLFQGDAALKDFIDALTAKETGITEKDSLSYISIFELSSEDRLVMLTDTLIQSFPDIRQKVRILENAIGFAGILGIENPKIAVLSSVELVNLRVPSSVDAAVLSKMSERRQLKGIIDGPLDIDCASSRERARRKGLESPVAGHADIYLLPDIEAGYSTAEVLAFLGRTTLAGALIGTEVPVILNCRFESSYSLLLDIALASLRLHGRD
ncbi:MAG: phosphate butyryltransferase [Syntrophobacterales bacterium]|nr:phosphate butyryltransferase [Syntrophobacterales bacterium]